MLTYKTYIPLWNFTSPRLHVTFPTGNRLISNQTILIIVFLIGICDALRDLVAFVQFKKREKHPWRSVNFSKVAGIGACLF